MAVRLINPAPRHFNNSGAPLNSGVLSYYNPLTTTVKQSAATLSASGLEPDATVDGPCRVRLVDKNGVQLWSRDNVNDTESPPFALWSGFETYVLGDLVSSADGELFISLLPENFNNDPATSPIAWEQVYFIAGSSGALSSMASVIPLDSAMLLGNGTGWQSARLGDLARNYLAGLELSSAADVDHDITVSAGRCSDSTNTISMGLTEITKRIDETWSAGDGNGGLASGITLSNTTWYHVFVVKVGQVVDVMFDTSVVCANGVANNAVTHFRRIGSVLTNSSSNIIQFVQKGRYFYWLEPTFNSGEFTGIDPVGQLRTIATPLGVAVKALMQVRLTMTTAVPPTAPIIYTSISNPSTPYVKPSSTKYDCAVRTDTNTECSNMTSITMTNTSSQIRCEYSDSVTMFITFLVKTMGWIDPRGQY